MASIIIQDLNGDSRVLQSKPFPYEDVLQRNIAELPSLVALDMVIDEPVSHQTVGLEWTVGSGRADIILVGSDALLTVIETKLNRNPEARREVIAQILEYAAYLSEWTIVEIQHRADDFIQSDDCPAAYRGTSFDQVLQSLLDQSGNDASVNSFKSDIEQNLRQGRMRLVVAVDEVGEQAQKIVSFVNAYSSFDIYLLQVSVFEDAQRGRIFAPSLHGYARKMQTSRVRVNWNWEMYESELSWTADQIQRSQELVGQLEAISAAWNKETRFHPGWISVRCFGKEAFGVQVSKKRGLELWLSVPFREARHP